MRIQQFSNEGRRLPNSTPTAVAQLSESVGQAVRVGLERARLYSVKRVIDRFSTLHPDSLDANEVIGVLVHWADGSTTTLMFAEPVTA